MISLAIAAAIAAPARAQPADAGAARRHLTRGQVLLQQGSYATTHHRADDARRFFESAIGELKQAVAADPSAHYELAVAYDALGKPDEAVRQLRAFAPGARPQLASKASHKLDDVMAKVGTVTLNVTPAGAQVTLGGVELGAAPLAEPLILLPGTYTLAFQAAGFQPREAELKVDAGSENERAIELERVPIIVQPVAPLVAAPVREAPPPRSRAPLYAGAAVALAGVAGATVFGLRALGRHDTYVAPETRAPDREDARTSGKRFALASDLSAAVAVVAAGFTLTWYFAKYRQKPEERRPPTVAAKLDLVPWVQSQSGGVTLAGRF